MKFWLKNILSCLWSSGQIILKSFHCDSIQFKKLKGKAFNPGILIHLYLQVVFTSAIDKLRTEGNFISTEQYISWNNCPKSQKSETVGCFFIWASWHFIQIILSGTVRVPLFLKYKRFLNNKIIFRLLRYLYLKLNFLSQNPNHI